MVGVLKVGVGQQINTGSVGVFVDGVVMYVRWSMEESL